MSVRLGWTDCHTFVLFICQQGLSALTAIHLLIFEFFKHLPFAYVWRTTLKLGCITNFDTLFLVMGCISLDDALRNAKNVGSSTYLARPHTTVWAQFSSVSMKELRSKKPLCQVFGFTAEIIQADEE